NHNKHKYHDKDKVKDSDKNHDKDHDKDNKDYDENDDKPHDEDHNRDSDKDYDKDKDHDPYKDYDMDYDKGCHCMEAETWTLRRSKKKQIEAFEMWIWRRMERVKWTDRIRNEAVLETVGEERMMLKQCNVICPVVQQEEREMFRNGSRLWVRHEIGVVLIISQGLIISRAVASRSKASCLGLALRNVRWFESSWEKKCSHEISASVWDRCPPSIVMHLGSYNR
ncbi:hypothetical protein ANN_02718, partial [Periplaneta americana]